jgi:hypothetical protein
MERRPSAVQPWNIGLIRAGLSNNMLENSQPQDLEDPDSVDDSMDQELAEESKREYERFLIQR